MNPQSVFRQHALKPWLITIPLLQVECGFQFQAEIIGWEEPRANFVLASWRAALSFWTG